MKPIPIIRAAILTTCLANALLVGAAHADPTPATDDGVNLCVEMREKIFECKEEFADAFVEHHNVPAAEKAATRAKAVEEITADGAGPLEPRRQACADTMKKGAHPPADKVAAMKQGLAKCAAEPNCKARVACLMPLIRPMVGKGKSVQH
jgi:hypothetical protein